MKVKSITTAKSELAKAEQLTRRRRKALNEAERSESQARAAVHRETIRSLVGQQVRRRTRCSSHPNLNDAIGVLKSVQRLWCVVDFGQLGEWKMRIDETCGVDQPQGWEIEI